MAADAAAGGGLDAVVDGLRDGRRRGTAGSLYSRSGSIAEQATVFSRTVRADSIVDEVLGRGREVVARKIDDAESFLRSLPDSTFRVVKINQVGRRGRPSALRVVALTLFACVRCVDGKLVRWHSGRTLSRISRTRRRCVAGAVPLRQCDVRDAVVR
jgi:hypothetical protein